jgi:hypothetical protein
MLYLIFIRLAELVVLLARSLYSQPMTFPRRRLVQNFTSRFSQPRR